MIAVFAYAFPHRKSRDILTELALAGEKDVCVIAAPFEKLPVVDRTRYMQKALKSAPPQDTQIVAERLGFEYVEMRHSDIENVQQLVADRGITLGIVAGARIIKAVIEAFSDGIVNFHPGRIPETSGLDAFFYTIKKGVDARVTTHFIDPRVDAGHQVYFDAVQVGPADTAEIVQENGYHLQITALRRFLADRRAGTLVAQVIDWSGKNQPMTPEEKWQTLLHFPTWRAARVMAQAAEKLHVACSEGEIDQIARLLESHPNLLETRTAQGWSPLILAAFHQHYDASHLLLSQGANPNATGQKGTTVLMYAKTALMGQKAPDTGLLDLLIEYGADPDRRDMYGRGILHYVTADPALMDYFKHKGATE